ncbi:hypothetical protein DENSPDRAFT_845097 [Dentipellis sp. KUC8613]|nr:hypothetical protein DENSPDRAFT_845097 [Dentipellis sp. KUC8613]
MASLQMINRNAMRYSLETIDHAHNLVTYAMENGPADADLRRRVDDDLDSLKRTIADFCHRRDALLPIARIPDETMFLIFKLCVESDVAPDSGNPFQFLYHGTPQSWVTPSSPNKPRSLPVIFIISQVCRSWRVLASTHHGLWCKIPTHHPECMSTMLRKSLHTRLSLDLRFGAGEEDPVFTFYKQAIRENNIGRVGKLTLSIPTSAVAQGALNLLGINKPSMLETLEINVAWPPAPILTTIMTRTIIPNPLLSHLAQRLHHLSLFNCMIGSPSFPQFTSLRTLRLGSDSCHWRQTVVELLSALQQMLQLESLLLKNATQDTSIVQAHPLILPHLSSLAWHHSIGPSQAFLTNILLRYMSTIVLSIEIVSESNPILTSLLSFLLNSGTGPRIEPFQALELCYHPYTPRSQRLTVKAWQDSDTDRDPEILLRLSWDHRRFSSSVLLRTLCHDLKLNNLRILILSDGKFLRLTDAEHRHAFGEMSSVTDIRIIGGHSMIFLCAIATPASAEYTFPFLFPALARLEIHQVSLNGRASFIQTRLSKILERFLRSRTIDSLSLIGCSSVDETLVGTYRNLVNSDVYVSP